MSGGPWTTWGRAGAAPEAVDGDDVRRSMDDMGDMVEDAGRGLEDAVRNGQVFR